MPILDVIAHGIVHLLLAHVKASHKDENKKCAVSIC